jgi:D-glycero-D-manno-heptose 1,7-bisphosphate phosphatase
MELDGVDVQAPLERAQGAARRMKVAVLAGGFGTRLGDLTRDRPKPMIEIGGTPYLEYVVESFRGFEVVLLTGHKSEVIEAHFGDRVLYARESEPLGTGGALRAALPLLGDRFIVTYGDVLRRFDYDRFVKRHQIPALAVYPRIGAGNTEIDGDRVVRFDKRATELPYVDAGFSLMDASIASLLPVRGSFEESVFPTLAAEGRLAAEVVDHDFFDIGTPKELQRTRAALES